MIPPLKGTGTPMSRGEMPRPQGGGRNLRYCPAGQGSSSSPLLSQQPKEDTAALSLGEVLTQLGAASCPGCPCTTTVDSCPLTEGHNSQDPQRGVTHFMVDQRREKFTLGRGQPFGWSGGSVRQSEWGENIQVQRPCERRQGGRVMQVWGQCVVTQAGCEVH